VHARTASHPTLKPPVLTQIRPSPLVPTLICPKSGPKDPFFSDASPVSRPATGPVLVEASYPVRTLIRSWASPHLQCSTAGDFAFVWTFIPLFIENRRLKRKRKPWSHRPLRPRVTIEQMVSRRKCIRVEVLALVVLAETAEHGVPDVGERSVHLGTGLCATTPLRSGWQVKMSWRDDPLSQRKIADRVVLRALALANPPESCHAFFLVHP
jgi:hypothetical protein